MIPAFFIHHNWDMWDIIIILIGLAIVFRKKNCDVVVKYHTNIFDVSDSSCFCNLQMGTKVCEEVGKRG